ncbi:hypothetical protein HA402_005380 [Bradysia odoriphaga]|nr:hypothetical protein HA402_005380 [Bradysia odoriphaga]
MLILLTITVVLPIIFGEYQELELIHWEDKIRVDANVNSIVETYNRSMGYLSSLHTANQLLRIQKKLGIKGYHITERRIANFFNSYIVHEAFPFIERLNEIIQRLQSAGLYDEWDRRNQYLSDKAFLEQKLELFANQKASGC